MEQINDEEWEERRRKDSEEAKVLSRVILEFYEKIHIIIKMS